MAAPIEGRRARTWLSIGIVGGLLAACCVVGGTAVGGLLIVGGEAVNEQAQSAVEDYLTAVAAQEWAEAYEQRCASDRAEETLAEFVLREGVRPRIASYTVGDLDTVALTVPVQVSYTDGSQGMLSVPVEQNNTGQFEVCGTIT